LVKTSVETVAPLGVALGAGLASIWSMTARERLTRIFARAGLEVAETPSPGRAVVFALADWVFDESLIATLAKRPGSVLVTEDGVPVAAHVDADGAAATSAALERGEM